MSERGLIYRHYGQSYLKLVHGYPVTVMSFLAGRQKRTEAGDYLSLPHFSDCVSYPKWIDYKIS